MLKELKCNLLINPTIEFHAGLNAVLGDNYSTNSIGKSTLLMIIDFVFGGDSYLKKNSGSLKQVGHHRFDFKFLFDTDFYFSRGTENPNIVNYCDPQFNVINEVGIDDYLALLKAKYQLPSAISFRGAVGLYARIWGKDNYNVDKPLKSFPAEKEIQSIETLVKLFGKYDSINNLVARIKDLDESQKLLSGLHKKNFVDKLNKSKLLENKKRVGLIKAEITDIQNNLLKYTINIEQLTNKELLALKTDKSQLLTSLNSIDTKIKRIELSLNESSIKSKHLKKLSSFFSNVNEKKIGEIESFHNKLGSILRRELSTALSLLQQKRLKISEEVDLIDARINNLLENVESPKYIVEKVYDLTVEANKIESTVKFNEDRVSIESQKKDSQANLDDVINTILQDIESQINNELVEVNKQIHAPNRKIPRLILKRKSFSFDHSENTGTGKSYADLIEFDLAILRITSLPLVIHDSILFKNIEDLAVDKIIQQYLSIDKRRQVFIALDGVNRYSQESQEVLQAAMILYLSEARKLFNKDWR